MQALKKMLFLAALMASAPAAFAHERGGWASIHWHASDFLGLAVVGVLAVAAILVARRQQRTKQKNEQ